MRTQRATASINTDCLFKGCHFASSLREVNIVCVVRDSNKDAFWLFTSKDGGRIDQFLCSELFIQNADWSKQIYAVASLRPATSLTLVFLSMTWFCTFSTRCTSYILFIINIVILIIIIIEQTLNRPNSNCSQECYLEATNFLLSWLSGCWDTFVGELNRKSPINICHDQLAFDCRPTWNTVFKSATHVKASACERQYS